MNYRKMRKAYCRRFGHYASYSLYDKEGRKMIKASKRATAVMLKMSLHKNKSSMRLIAEEIKKHENEA